MFSRSIIYAIVLGAPAYAWSDIKLDLFLGESKIGTGTYSESFDHHGRKTSVTKLWGKNVKGVKMTITQIKEIDKDGYPIHEEETVIEGTGKQADERNYNVKYDSTGAAILILVTNKRATTERSFVPPPGLSRADASDLWFSKTKPLSGTSIRSTVFDIENMSWQIVETTFVGKRWVTASGRSVEANLIVDIRDGVKREVYLDDKGLPVLMKTGPHRVEKHF